MIDSWITHQKQNRPIDPCATKVRDWPIDMFERKPLPYIPVHLVESVENYALCMRRCPLCSSNLSVTHNALAFTRANRTNAGAKLLSLPLSCTGCKFYWLDDLNWSRPLHWPLGFVYYMKCRCSFKSTGPEQNIICSLWASNRNPAPPGGFLETTIFGNLSHRAIEIRLTAKIPVLDKAVRALFFSKWPPNFNKCLGFGTIFLYSTIFIQFNEL